MRALCTWAMLALPTVLAAASPPLSLPPEAEVRQALEQAPRLQAAHESIPEGQALERQLRAGTHEWEVSALSQRRTDPAGIPYTEQEYGLQRGVRWPWKTSLDRRIGAQAREIGELAYLDNWHEASRTLLDLWFGWLDAEKALRLLDDQLALLTAQQQVVQRRVDAGDAARLELQLAMTETRRLQAMRGEAARQAMQAREALTREFPHLASAAPARLAEPAGLPEDDEVWIERIIDANHETTLADTRAAAASLAAERAGRERLADPTIGLMYSDNLDGNRKVVGLRVSLPLGGSARSASAALSRSQARAAASTATGTLLAVESAARVAVHEARLRQQAWQELSAALRQAQETADAVARGYTLGEFDSTTLFNSRRTALETQQLAESAQVAALRAHARVLLDAHVLWEAPHHDEGHDAVRR